MEQVIIYGAGNKGKSAYFYFKNNYKCLFFVDSDSNKWGEKIDGLEIKSPLALRKINNIKIIVASVYWREIVKELEKIGKFDLFVYLPTLKKEYLLDSVKKELGERTIDLGMFMKEQKKLFCKEMTFMQGGSQILDYMFLKYIAHKYNCKKYLEIGTYIGESINILTDYCEKLYSITAPIGTPYSMTTWCQNFNLPDYSERLTYSPKIKHIFVNSKKFDFSSIEDDIDLYFIDADHSYEGVFADTLNVFKNKKENAIVIWHDFREARFQYNEEVIKAVNDVLGEKFKNVYVTDRNSCGIYLPDNCIADFSLKELRYGENLELYTYDVILNNIQIK